jgi:hypothetical protein
MTIKNENDLRSVLDRAISQVRIIDIHTHTYPVDFGKLLLWGIDELMTYHYLAAETLRWTDMPYSTYWAMTKREQADLIWQTLFIDNTPYSEACRGVLTVLEKLGLDTGRRDLEAYRRYFAAVDTERRAFLIMLDPVFVLAACRWAVDNSFTPHFRVPPSISELNIAWCPWK